LRRECGSCRRYKNGTISVGGCTKPTGFKAVSKHGDVCELYDPRSRRSVEAEPAVIKTLTGETVLESMIPEKLRIGGVDK